MSFYDSRTTCFDNTLRPTSEIFSRPVEPDRDLDSLLVELVEPVEGTACPTKVCTTPSLPEVTNAGKEPVPTDLRTAISEQSAGSPAQPLYAFPYADQRFIDERARTVRMCDTEVERAFRTAIASLSRPFSNGAHDRGYLNARARICALAITMNERRGSPPVLREWINLNSSPKSLNEEQKIASNDIQVVDLHWLHTGGFVPTVSRWSEMFGENFDFETAALFVQTLGKTERKASELGLMRREMLLLKSIGSTVVRQRQREIREHLEARKGLIRTALSEPQCRQKCSHADMVHSCQALMLADLDIEQAVFIAQCAHSLTVSNRDMKRRRTWLLRYKFLHPVGKPKRDQP